MAKRKVVLTFPREKVNQPIIYRLVKDYELILNILRAEVMPKEIGRMVIELQGPKTNIEKGLKYLKRQLIEIESLEKDIIFDDEECISCGACLAVCHTGALFMDKDTYEVKFNRDNCLLCEHCVIACPLRVIRTAF
jgi:ferredoxin